MVGSRCALSPAGAPRALASVAQRSSRGTRSALVTSTRSWLSPDGSPTPTGRADADLGKRSALANVDWRAGAGEDPPPPTLASGRPRGLPERGRRPSRLGAVLVAPADALLGSAADAESAESRVCAGQTGQRPQWDSVRQWAASRRRAWRRRRTDPSRGRADVSSTSTRAQRQLRSQPGGSHEIWPATHSPSTIPLWPSVEGRGRRAS